jgi:splicing factor 3B subunit 3
VAVCQFATRGDVEWFVVVGTARDLTLAPKTCSGGSLILFRMSPDGSKLEHVHSVSQSSLFLFL